LGALQLVLLDLTGNRAAGWLLLHDDVCLLLLLLLGCGACYQQCYDELCQGVRAAVQQLRSQLLLQQLL
jgi:hypothetical protein